MSKAFYDDVNTKTWLSVLDKNRCYCWGELNAVDRICSLLANDRNQLVYDCGCGWGGPAEYITDKTKKTVVGITNSENQYKWYQAELGLPIMLVDLDKRFPQYKVESSAYFINSFTHLRNPIDTLTNMRSGGVTDIYIHDLIKTNLIQTAYDPEWKMTIYTVPDLINVFGGAGYVMKKWNIEEKSKQWVVRSAMKWLGNINNLNGYGSTSQIASLKRLCENVIKKNGDDIELVYFHFALKGPVEW